MRLGVVEQEGDYLEGDRVRASELIDLMPYAIIAAGEHGTVTGTGVPGGIEVRFDRYHIGLLSYDNCFVLVRPEIAVLRHAASAMVERVTAAGVTLCALVLTLWTKAPPALRAVGHVFAVASFGN